MDWQVSLYLVPLVLAGLISGTLALLAYPKRDSRTAPQTIAILLSATIWALADAARLFVVDLSWKLTFLDIRFVGSTLLVLATWLFALEFTNRERWLTRSHIVAYGAPFAVTLVLVATSGTLEHGLIRSGVVTLEQNGLQLADIQFGPWFYVNAAYSYSLLLATMTLYGVEVLRRPAGIYRRQTVAIAISLLVPWILNALYLADVTLVDLTAVGLTVTGVAYYAAIFWYDLLDLVPIARSTLVDHIEHGVIVIDPGITSSTSTTRWSRFSGERMTSSWGHR